MTNVASKVQEVVYQQLNMRHYIRIKALSNLLYLTWHKIQREVTISLIRVSQRAVAWNWSKVFPLVGARTKESETKQNAFPFSKGLLLSTEIVLVVISSENMDIHFWLKRFSKLVRKLLKGPNGCAKYKKLLKNAKIAFLYWFEWQHCRNYN